jgi:hypothetical protein
MDNFNYFLKQKSAVQVSDTITLLKRSIHVHIDLRGYAVLMLHMRNL